MVWVAALQCKDLVSVYFSLRYRRRVCLCINYSFVVWVAALQYEDMCVLVSMDKIFIADFNMGGGAAV